MISSFHRKKILLSFSFSCTFSQKKSFHSYYLNFETRVSCSCVWKLKKKQVKFFLNVFLFPWVKKMNFLLFSTKKIKLMKIFSIYLSSLFFEFATLCWKIQEKFGSKHHFICFERSCRQHEWKFSKFSTFSNLPSFYLFLWNFIIFSLFYEKRKLFFWL